MKSFIKILLLVLGVHSALVAENGNNLMNPEIIETEDETGYVSADDESGYITADEINKSLSENSKHSV